MSTKEIFKKIDSYKKEVIDLQTALTAIPALSPTIEGGEGEYDKAVYIESVLKKMKFDEVKRYDAPDKTAKKGIRPNIVAKYYGKDKTKNFWLMAHMDIVAPGDLSLWKTDPYKAVVKGDKIYGRGTEDNQQGFISSLLTIKAMMDLGIRPPVNICLLCISDEETGSKFGIHYLVKKYPSMFTKNDSIMIPDGGNAQGTEVEIAEKSIYWIKFIVKGKQVHGSTPDKGINAHRASANLITMLDKELYKKFNKKNKVFGPPSYSTFEPTKKDNNVASINIIPGEDIFYFDCRVIPDYKLADVRKSIDAIVKKVEKQFKVKVIIDEIQRESSLPTSPKAPIVTKTMEALKSIYKNKPKTIGIGGGTVAAPLRNKGIACVVYGKLDDTMHSPNEYSSIKNTLGDAKVFAHIAMNLK